MSVSTCDNTEGTHLEESSALEILPELGNDDGDDISDNDDNDVDVYVDGSTVMKYIHPERFMISFAKWSIVLGILDTINF